MPILEARKRYLGEQAWSLMLPCGHGTLWPVFSLPHAGEKWGQQPGGDQSSLWVGSGLGGQSGVAVGRASGGGNDPGLPCCSSRPDGDSSLHPATEPHLHVQAGLVLHAEVAGGVPAVHTTEQVLPRLWCGQTRYGTGPAGLGDSLRSLLHGHQLFSPAQEHCQRWPGACYPRIHPSPIHSFFQHT